ncbi:MAG: threonine/serine dehydratase [Bauldia sp.]|nr:threonine/serine dehydratase [Bauldia sp.]
MNTSLPGLDDVRAAAARLTGLAVRTPLLTSPYLDALTGARVLTKPECLQRTGSFKFRGGYNAVATLDPAVRARGVVAVSSGNHAQGVAEAARLFGVPATIVMPADAPASKRRRTERSGATVVAYDRATEDRDRVAAALLAERGGTLIHPYDDAAVIAGQGTVGLEIAADAVAMGAVPDLVAVPCSGGGLGAGVGLAVRATFPDCALVVVEPEGFDDYARSLAAGTPVANARQAGSICDALMATAPGSIGFALNRAADARAVAVSDAEALAAVAFAFEELKLVVEPGGAVALAAVLSGRLDVRGRTIAIVLSGGNIDLPVLERALGAA